MSTRPRYLDAVLRVVAEPSVSAHYGCLRCPFTKSVRGARKVTTFVPTIRATHRATCPGRQAPDQQSETPGMRTPSRRANAVKRAGQAHNSGETRHEQKGITA